MNKVLLQAVLAIALTAILSNHARASDSSPESAADASDPVVVVNPTSSIDEGTISDATPADEASPVTETTESGDAVPAPVSTAHMMNTSARMKVGTGDDVGILGFVITGEGNRTVLIRGVGPALTKMGLSGALADPKVELYSGSTLVQSNDNWSSNADVAAADVATATADIAAASAAAGAAPFEADSKDAAMVATLSPGAYTIVLSGAGNATGMALVEVYDLP